MTKFNKSKLVLRQQLVGAGYFEALAAMEFASRLHSGLRKDNITPEFHHQVGIALYVMTLPDLIDREACVATALLHDTKEDIGVSDGEMLSIFQNKKFGMRVVESTDCVTKKFRGVLRNEDELFERMSNNAVASIVKGADRINNIQSMVGVFTPEKQYWYIDFAKVRILPMLKKARRNFPHQTMAYENIKFVMNSQIELVEASLAANEPS